PEMDRAIGQAIFHGVVPTAVLGGARVSKNDVIPDIRKGIAAAGRIVKQHRIGAERALTAKGQRAEMRGRYPAIVFVIEGLARARAVDGVRIAPSGKAVVGGVGRGRTG